MPPSPEILQPPPGLLSTPPQEVFKEDGRSRVWLAEGDGHKWVVKQYTYARLRQALAWIFGIHPAQRERRSARRLAKAGLRVVPPAAVIWSGGRVHSISEHAGESYQRLILQGLLRDPAWRRRLTDELADCAAELIERGWFFRDLQPPNLVRGPDSAAWLIDVGSARRSQSPRHVVRMLGLMVHVMRYEGATRNDAARVLRCIMHRRPWRDWPAAEELDDHHRLVQGVIAVVQQHCKS